MVRIYSVRVCGGDGKTVANGRNKKSDKSCFILVSLKNINDNATASIRHYRNREKLAQSLQHYSLQKALIAP